MSKLNRPAVLWLPALGVGVRPNQRFADALRVAGIEIVVHEWRGLGSSPLRASRACDWGYRELLLEDIPTALAQAKSSQPDRDWWIGGHSLGGQLALLHAARQPESVKGSLLIASGQPHWRAFGGLKALGILAFMLAVPLVSLIVGHYPGQRLGFAGREAARLMRDWARTGRRGDYRLASLPWNAELDLQRYTGPIRMLHMADDALVPSGAVDLLQQKTPKADWQRVELHASSFAEQRADHFGWLKEPQPVVEQVLQWLMPSSAQGGL